MNKLFVIDKYSEVSNILRINFNVNLFVNINSWYLFLTRNTNINGALLCGFSSDFTAPL